MSEDLNSMQIFVKEIQKHSYAQKYRKWVQYLQKVQASSPQQYPSALTIFLQQFPFNYYYWLSYINHTNNFSLYQTALKRNSKSFQLWCGYLLGLKNQNCQPTKYKKQLQKAIIEVGADTRSVSFYLEYYNMVAQNFRYEFYKKIVTRALIGLEDIFDMFKKWLQQLSQQQVNLFYSKQLKSAISLSSEQTLQTRKTFLYDQIEKTYIKTLKYRQQRLQIQQKIQKYYFEGTQQQKDQKKYWQQLFQLQRKNGVIENISYCYQRSLMAQTDDFELWDEVFHYLQHETNKYTKVLSILRNNKTFFMKFSTELYFYWCDLQERQNPAKARQMYKQVCTATPTLQTYQRYIQFQIRQKSYPTAKQLYDTLLSIYQHEPQTLAYTLIEYSHFVIRYYKDYEYPKQLIKNYFDYLPYNSYLLTEYLQFMSHFQNNEGYYDELMGILCEAVKKAKKSLREVQFIQAIKTIRYYLRSVLGSIYLIKMSERRIMELAESIDVKKDQVYQQFNENAIEGQHNQYLN